MIRQNLDRQWSFKYASKYLNWLNNKGNILLDIPHDFGIGLKWDTASLSGSGNGYFPVAWLITKGFVYTGRMEG